MQNAGIYQQVDKDHEQIRTKGQRNSSTYAFFATKRFVNILLGLI